MAERDDGTVDIRPFVLPTRHSPADEGVTQIVNANLVKGQMLSTTFMPPTIEIQSIQKG
ncbi:hypothetical protein [Sinorhizobium meliloti]|uniref:hypothetical protein n=1 Tax=Rhizobium meliloti TaxID=382 RepID=UPI0012963D57|nr:hypothetical protein [Sinorhizobium meliloti]MQX90424.1 hypothetical protein [Sinorhizobium meliloti]